MTEAQLEHVLGVLPARGRSLADAHHHRSGAPFSSRAEQGAVPGAAAAQQTEERRRDRSGRPHRAPCSAPAGACALLRRHHRLHLPPRVDRSPCRPHVPRLRGAGHRRFPRHAQQQPLSAGRGDTLAAGKRADGAAQPPQRAMPSASKWKRAQTPTSSIGCA